ncbi:MAG TPA: DMT family transporter [bacterium]|jgi:drug/metabolite transporter (DMT)-like permease
MMPQFRRTVFSLMLLHVAISSGGYLFVKVGLAEFSSLAFAFWRFVIGLAGLLTATVVLKAWPRIDRKDWPRVLLLGALAVPANQLFYLVGMKHSVPSHASLIYGATAVIALVLSTVLGYEKLQRFKVVAISVSVLGLVLVVTSSRTPILGTENFGGDALITVSMFAWAGYTVFAKPLVAKYGAVQATLACLMVGTLMGLPFLIKPALAQDYSILTWRGWIGTAYSGIMSTCISYTVWFALLKRVDPSQVAIMTTPQPVVTTALSVLILGEALSLPLITGGLLVIGGVLLMQAPVLLANRRVAELLKRTHLAKE